MRKFICGLLVVSVIIAFPVAAAADCGGQKEMVYGNKWLGISERYKGPTYIHVVGRRIRVPVKGADADDVLLALCGGSALLVVAVVLAGFLAGKRPFLRVRP